MRAFFVFLNFPLDSTSSPHLGWLGGCWSAVWDITHVQCLMADDGASLAVGVAVGAVVVGMLLIGLPAIDLVV